MKSFNYSHLNNELTLNANIIVIEISVDNLNRYSKEFTRHCKIVTFDVTSPKLEVQ